jgi:hypothetical protein
MENLITWKDSCSLRCILSSPLLVSFSLSHRFHDHLDWPSRSLQRSLGVIKHFLSSHSKRIPLFHTLAELAFSIGGKNLLYSKGDKEEWTQEIGKRRRRRRNEGFYLTCTFIWSSVHFFCSFGVQCCHIFEFCFLNISCWLIYAYHLSYVCRRTYLCWVFGSLEWR